MPSRVLFISHTAERTGAPQVLLHLLRWLRETTSCEIYVLLKQGGPLGSQFAELGTVINYEQYLGQTNRSVSQRALGRLLNRTQLDSGETRRRYLAEYFRRVGIDLIYSNTVTNGEVLQELAGLQCPVITHAHELDYWIWRSGQDNWRQVRQFTDFYIAASYFVAENLVRGHDVSPERIDVIHEFIDAPPTKGGVDQRAEVRDQLGIPPDAVVIGAVGAEYWRKGKDLFIQLAYLVNNRIPEAKCHFVWIGRMDSPEQQYQLQHDARLVGLESVIRFVPEVADPFRYYEAMDIFVLVSREDPFPLVCLEAALCSKPILCFASAGGMPEFVENDAGVVVPYLDVWAMAKEIERLIQDPETRLRYGQRASQKVRERHTVQIAAPQVLDVIKRFVDIEPS